MFAPTTNLDPNKSPTHNMNKADSPQVAAETVAPSSTEGGTAGTVSVPSAKVSSNPPDSKKPSLTQSGGSLVTDKPVQSEWHYSLFTASN